MITIKDTERVDDLQCNGYRIIQEPDGFCFGIDAVLLANFACEAVLPESRVLDLGTGTGIVPLLIAAKTEAQSITGYELQDEVAEMAERSVLLNEAENRISIVRGDVRDIRTILTGDSIDIVTSNPPYMNAGLKSTENRKLISRHEVEGCFSDFVKAASYMLRSGGKFFLVHRPNRLPEIITELKKYRLEPKRLRLVHPYVEKEANLFLLEAVKEARPQLRVMPPLIVYESVNKYTEEINRIYGRNT